MRDVTAAEREERVKSPKVSSPLLPVKNETIRNNTVVPPNAAVTAKPFEKFPNIKRSIIPITVGMIKITG